MQDDSFEEFEEEEKTDAIKLAHLLRLIIIR